MRPGIVIIGLWLAWAVSWTLASFWSNRTQARPVLASEIRYRLPMILGGVVMFVPAHGYEGPLRLWHIGWIGAWTCIVFEALGIAFAWWARVHLGRLWSGNITRKTDHRVIDTGPYALVRHPIYTGLLLSLLATAAAKGTILGVTGFALLLLGIWMKARLEEQWLIGELGEGDYVNYQRRVPMLLPWGPRRR